MQHSTLSRPKNALHLAMLCMQHPASYHPAKGAWCMRALLNTGAGVPGRACGKIASAAPRQCLVSLSCTCKQALRSSHAAAAARPRHAATTCALQHAAARLADG